MNNLIPFIIKSSISLLVLYSYYFLVLKKTTNYEINRFYLLFSLLFSISIPFVSYTIETNEINYNSHNMINILLDEIQIVTNYNTQINPKNNILPIISTLYFTGVVFLSFKLIYGIYRINYLINKNEKKRDAKYQLIKLNGTNSSFSFFKYIFIGDVTSTSNNDIKKIIAHEKVHAEQLHSIDIILIEIATIFLWVNPLIWLIRKAIKDNHEYIADNEVIKKYPAGTYLQLLLNQTTKARISYGNCFAYSNLKKRMIMISKKTSGKYSLVRYIPAIMTVLILFISFACSNEANEATSQNSENEIKVKNQKNIEVLKLKEIEDNNENVFLVVENMPEYPGGKTALNKYILSNLKYPKEAQEKSIQGRVFIGFVIDTDGSITKARVLRKANPLLEQEALRVINSMPKWKPGTQKGEKVKVNFTIPINFSLK